MGEVPRRTSLAPLASPCFEHCLLRVETEGVLDYQGRAGIISIVRWILRPVIFGVELKKCSPTSFCRRALSGLVAGDSAIWGLLAGPILRLRPAVCDLGSSDHLKYRGRGGGGGSDPVRIGTPPPGNGPWPKVRCWVYILVSYVFLYGIVFGSLSWSVCDAINICGHVCSEGPAKSRTHPLRVSVIWLE